MIPYDIMRAKINQNISVSIESASIYGFSFKIDHLLDISKIEISLYSLKKNIINHLIIDEFEVELEEKNEFYYIYHVEFDHLEYQRLFKEMIKEYQSVIQMKKGGKDLLDQKQYTLTSDDYQLDFSRLDHIGIVISDIDLFLKDEKAYLDRYPFHIDSIYIGSQYCMFQLPDVDVVNHIQFKHVVLMFPPIKENELGWMEDYINHLTKKVEIVVNDPGLLLLLQNYDFSITLGINMIKMVKDPRKKYLPYEVKSNGISFKMMELYSTKYKVKRFSVETCEEELIYNESFDLYLPYYTTNLATYCTYYSYYHEKSRYHALRVEKCPMYCKQHRFEYPDHLHMKAKQNALVALDQRAKIDIDYILKFNCGRVIINDEDYCWNEFNR